MRLGPKLRPVFEKPYSQLFIAESERMPGTNRKHEGQSAQLGVNEKKMEVAIPIGGEEEGAVGQQDTSHSALRELSFYISLTLPLKGAQGKQ
jgi:hypothetical protein